MCGEFIEVSTNAARIEDEVYESGASVSCMRSSSPPGPGALLALVVLGALSLVRAAMASPLSAVLKGALMIAVLSAAVVLPIILAC